MSDGIRAFFIIFIFMMLNTFIMTKTGVSSVQNDWVNQRCNPLVMPFAGSLSPDGTSTSDNFSYCIQNTVGSYSSVVTQPFEYAQSMNVDAINNLSDTATANQQQQQQTSDNMGSVASGIYETFLNIIIVFNVMVLKLYDSQGKMSGVVVTLMNILQTLSNTGMSIWNGPPGQIMRAISKIHV